MLGALAPADASGTDTSAESEANDAKAMREKFDALGVAIRAGVDPDDAAARLGLAGIGFTGAVPTTLRMPADDATALEPVGGVGG